MKRFLAGISVVCLLTAVGCKKTETPVAATKITDLSVLADAVPKEGPRTDNNYKVFFKALRQNQLPAEGFRIDAWVKGKSEPKTLITDADGIVSFTDLPFPDMKNKLMLVLHYYNGKKDDAREITYPFIESDAYRLKDTQYIPNTATAEPS